MHIKYKLLITLWLCALVCTGCGKTTDSFLKDLGSENDKKIETAIKELSVRPEAMPFVAAALATRDKPIRDRYFRVIDRAGELALDAMLDNIRYVRISNDHFNEFVHYFEKQTHSGYHALIHSYNDHGRKLAQGVQSGKFGADVMSHFDRMEDLSKILMALKEHKDEGNLPRSLLHPFPGARELTTKILCMKNWQPVKDGDFLLQYVYAANRIPLTGCPVAANALEEASAIMKQDFTGAIAAERQYPSPAGAFYKILETTGTDEVVSYVKKRCSETDNRYIFVQLFRVLEHIDSPASRSAQKEILAQKDFQALKKGTKTPKN